MNGRDLLRLILDAQSNRAGEERAEDIQYNIPRADPPVYSRVCREGRIAVRDQAEVLRSAEQGAASDQRVGSLLLTYLIIITIISLLIDYLSLLLIISLFVVIIIVS